MSFLVPCELSGLAALYETKTHTLIITAKGEAPGWYIGPFIEPEPHWVGGLKFSLRAYAGGLGKHPDMKPFEVTYKMPIILPNPVVIGKEVIIATANNPHGFVVPIRYTGLKEDGSTSVITSDNSDAPNLSVVLPPITIYVPGEGKPFQITAADAGAHGSVRVCYNKAAIKLEDAGIEGNNIKWVFEATKLGETNIEVTSMIFEQAHPAWAPLMKIQPYLVKVVVLKEDSA
ncbi:hypothetical protein MMC30_003698 [Trapelia coarctata]|nr:hypothetical protein [Trapelia coarctata]